MRGRKHATYEHDGAKIHLVKIVANEDGDPVEYPKWCLSEQQGDSYRTICSGEVYGIGEGSAEYEYKTGFGRDITCQRCLRILKLHHEIKL